MIALWSFVGGELFDERPDRADRRRAGRGNHPDLAPLRCKRGALLIDAGHPLPECRRETDLPTGDLGEGLGGGHREFTAVFT